MLVGKTIRIEFGETERRHYTVAAVSFEQASHARDSCHCLLLLDHEDGEITEYHVTSGQGFRMFVDAMFRDQVDDVIGSLTAARDSARIELQERTAERDDARRCAERLEQELADMRDRLREVDDQICQAEREIDNPIDSDAPVGLHVVPASDAPVDRVANIRARLDAAIVRTAAIVTDHESGTTGALLAAQQLCELTTMQRDLAEYQIHAESAWDAFLARLERKVPL
jgi:hypothetical protein